MPKRSVGKSSSVSAAKRVPRQPYILVVVRTDDDMLRFVFPQNLIGSKDRVEELLSALEKAGEENHIDDGNVDLWKLACMLGFVKPDPLAYLLADGDQEKEKELAAEWAGKHNVLSEYCLKDDEPKMVMRDVSAVITFQAD